MYDMLDGIVGLPTQKSTLFSILIAIKECSYDRCATLVELFEGICRDGVPNFRKRV